MAEKPLEESPETSDRSKYFCRVLNAHWVLRCLSNCIFVIPGRGRDIESFSTVSPSTVRTLVLSRTSIQTVVCPRGFVHSLAWKKIFKNFLIWNSFKIFPVIPMVVRNLRKILGLTSRFFFLIKPLLCQNMTIVFQMKWIILLVKKILP